MTPLFWQSSARCALAQIVATAFAFAEAPRAVTPDVVQEDRAFLQSLGAAAPETTVPPSTPAAPEPAQPPLVQHPVDAPAKRAHAKAEKQASVPPPITEKTANSKRSKREATAARPHIGRSPAPPLEPFVEDGATKPGRNVPRRSIEVRRAEAVHHDDDRGDREFRLFTKRPRNEGFFDRIFRDDD